MPHEHNTGYSPSNLPHGRGHFALQQPWSTPYIDHHPSYNPPSFYPVGVTYCPTAHSHAHSTFAHTSYGHCGSSVIPFNGGSPSTPQQQHWNASAVPHRQYMYEPTMQRIPFQNELVGDSPDENGFSGWR
ncbi:hypothetical protein AAF712_015827 [Marasmius tenuissimus]|uniref:Uncharacterized protein n=1 Tax=Marasmius tenuissimus TaxID=585030 RepID=A0ABR2Z8C1_9AGAR